MKLKPRHERFVNEYLVDLSAKEAAIRAGYSKATAREQGYQLLQRKDVQARIAQKQEALAAKHNVTQDRIIAELAKIGFSNMMDYTKVSPDGDPYVFLGDLSRDQAAAISEITVEDFKDGRGEDARDVKRIKFKLHDKRAALVDLGKHLGMFKEKVELGGPGGQPLVVEIVRFSEDPAS